MSNHNECVCPHQLVQAAMAGDRSRVLRCLDNCKAHVDYVDVVDDEGFTALLGAANLGHTEVVKVLIARGADVNYSGNRLTALMQAVQHGHVKVVKLLCAAGAKTQAVDNYGWTPLLMAAETGNVEISRTLCRHGADVNAVTTLRNTPLSIAAREGHADLVSYLLLETSADRTATDVQGFTALMLAAHNGRTDVVRVMCQADVDLTSSSRNGYTSLMIAADKGYTEVVRLLCEAGADNSARTAQEGSTACMIAAESGHLGVVRELCCSGADTNATSDRGFSATMIAAQNGHHMVIRELHSWGACMDHRNYLGSAALHLAAGRNFVKAATALLEVGCLETAKNNAGETPIRTVGSLLKQGKPRPHVEPWEGPAMRRLLARGPAFRACSWLWPKGLAGAEGIGDFSAATTCGRAGEAVQAVGAEREASGAVPVKKKKGRTRVDLDTLRRTRGMGGKRVDMFYMFDRYSFKSGR